MPKVCLNMIKTFCKRLQLLRGIAVDAGDGDGDATEGGDETAVSGDAHDVALEAREGTRDDTHQVVALGIVVQGMVQETDAGGLYLRGTHKGLHDIVGDYGCLPRAAVTTEVGVHGAFAEEGLHGLRFALHEEETGYGGTLLVAHSTLVTMVDDVGVHEGGEVLGKGLANMLGASMHVEVAPGGGGGSCCWRVHRHW